MATPMVVGAAALLKSYFPELSMLEIKDIILSSVQNVTEYVTPLPGEPETMVTFEELCKSAGIVNVYNAVELAQKKTSN
jgi:hypothetical protein